MQGFASLFYLFHYIFLSNVRLEICSTLQQALEENIIKCLCKEVEKNLHLLNEKCLRTCIDKNFSLPHRIIINLAIGAFRFGENLSYTPKAKLHFFPGLRVRLQSSAMCRPGSEEIFTLFGWAILLLDTRPRSHRYNK